MQTYIGHTNITIKAPVAKVWDALINPEIIKQYLYGTQITSDWKAGSPITWKGQFEGTAYEDKGTVLAYEPLKLLRYSHWSSMSGTEDKPENYHNISYELQEDGGQTVLNFSQDNAPTQKDADDAINDFWVPVLKTMKDVLEK